MDIGAIINKSWFRQPYLSISSTQMSPMEMSGICQSDVAELVAHLKITARAEQPH